MSLPTRERGLKFNLPLPQLERNLVAPYAGAWIEIVSDQEKVCPLNRSLPTRERGLKC
ncbi:hypothetical protein SBF1_4320007 [Candidatus Desulfosporosinus infrequens]|uniref:Uncharacterized protein n=1 Tax=Candidatus Desulfosporosinus infrequens TaxID=2043169 RepID=A0A2U3LB26_9FIRM|nr:hypothetical protein SBF1_4320007 [Candidatus Desulfosporosinus infrequens]